MIDFATVTARKLAENVRGGLNPAAVAEQWLAHIAQIEPTVRAFVTLGTAAGARSDGPLAGVPLGIKDVFDTHDLPTCYGSDAHAGWQPSRDATAVHLLRQAGGTILGKTVTTEFATYAPRGTLNPHDPRRTPGGSSSGSAAALAAGMVLLAIGTQTAGSTVRPASFCGVVGMKPSRGLIDTAGMKPLASSLDVVGPMARDMRDLALLCSVLMRRPDMLCQMESAPTIGLFLPQAAGVDDSVARAVIDRAATRLGHVSAVQTPAWWDGLGAAHGDVFAWEASASLGPERDLHSDRLQPRTLEFFEAHRDASHTRWLAGIGARDAALADLDGLFDGHDILLTQAAPGEAPVGTATGDATFNIRWTLLGCPTLTIPGGHGPEGMPVGLQIVARPGQDHLLLAAATRIEDCLCPT